MMKEKDIQVSLTRIWQVLSHVRGVMPDVQLQQVAIAFTFLRRLDCLIGEYADASALFYSQNRERLSDERLSEKLCEISGGYPFYNYSGYTFSGILNAKYSIEVVMNSYLQGFSKNVQEFLDGMEFYRNLAVMMRQSRYLVEMFELFSQMDLSASTVDNEEFVKLISSFLSDGIREFYTPLNLSHLICECLFAQDMRTSNEDVVTIYDPVCGTGCMLADAGVRAKRFAIHQDNISLCGQDVSMFPSAIAKALVLLSGNDHSKVFYGNTLTDDLFPDHRFQYILASLPFGLQWKPIRNRIVHESLGRDRRFHLGLPGTGDSQFLFIEHILSKMDFVGSRAAFITTGFVLWGGNASSGESRIRRWLFENDLVETIIALPSGTLTTTSVPVYLWILSNRKNDSQKGKVRLIDTTSNASKSNSFSLSDDFVKTVVDEYRSNIVSATSQMVRNEQFGYYEVALLANGKKKETVSISLDTDIQEFIKKERQPFTTDKITVDYNSVEKGYSVQFEKFFKQDKTPIASLKDETQNVMSVIDAISSLKSKMEQILANDEDSSISDSWRELPLRLATEVVFGVNRPPVSSVEGLPLLSVSYLRNPSSDENLYEVTPRTKFSTNKDVIIIVKGANSGEVFRGVDGILTPSVASVKCINESIIAPRYLYYLLKGYEKELMAKTKGATIKSLDSKSIPDLKCLIPPIKEQLKMAEWLDRIICKIDKAIEGLGCVNSIFSLYRQTLIENVVRGKVLIE